MSLFELYLFWGKLVGTRNAEILICERYNVIYLLYIEHNENSFGELIY